MSDICRGAGRQPVPRETARSGSNISTMRHFAGLALALVLALTATRIEHADAQGGPFRFSVTLPPTLSSSVDGRLLVIVSRQDEGEPRFQVSDGVGRPAGLRHRRRELGRSEAADDRRRGTRLPARQHQRHSGRHLHGAGAAPPLRDVQARRRPHREDADGSRRGPAVEPGAGQPLLDAEEGHVRSAQGRNGRDRARQGHPADRSAEGFEVHPPRADPERAADEVLGPADAPRRQRAPARGLGHASRRALSALHLPRPLSLHLRRLPRTAARSER